MKRGAVTNEEIAGTLDHVADLLELEHESGFRVRSYRNAAQTVRELETPMLSQSSRRKLRQALGDLPFHGSRLLRRCAPPKKLKDRVAWAIPACAGMTSPLPRQGLFVRAFPHRGRARSSCA